MTTSDTGVIAPLSQPIVDLSSGLPTKPMADFMFFVNKMAGTTDPTTQEKIDAILDRFNSNEGSIQQLVNDLLELSKGLGNQISEIRETVSEDKVSLARKITAITAALNDHAAAIMTAETSRVSDQEAIATVQQSLSARFGESQANIATEATARASADTTLSQLISTLSSTVNGQTTTLAEIAQSIDGIEGRWGVQIDANGRVTGIQLIGTGESSQFIIDADVIINGSLTTGKVAANAITATGYAYSAGEVGPGAVQSLTIATTGGPCLITASISGRNPRTSNGYVIDTMVVRRDGYEIWRGTAAMYNGAAGYGIFSCTLVDQPVAGIHSYAIEFTDNAFQRALTVMELKR